ncbi:MAG TPA: hypothetical protein ENI17_14455 [Pseudomonas xinjiangensis]|uniref:Uncharacterized protein n=2 Tax=root TaxID=1 RepID=A0A7V1BQ42_9GAMM|nr:hypothetical protein [Halopseudomonas xinjiangensis]HEC48808.1 hypothetical protein [Halopseudomonas xinjiangensis]
MPTKEHFINTYKSFGKAELYRQWHDVIFYSVWLRLQDGMLVPALLDVSGNVALTATPDRAEATAFLNRLDSPAGSRPVVVNRTLEELSRFCSAKGLLLNWSNQSLTLDSNLLQLMGYSAAAQTPSLGEVFIQAEARSYPLTHGPCSEAEAVAAQAWTLTPVGGRVASAKVEETWIVYEDDNHFLLPDSALVKKTCHRDELEPQLLVLYDKWKQVPEIVTVHPPLVDSNTGLQSPEQAAQQRSAEAPPVRSLFLYLLGATVLMFLSVHIGLE